jgi:hypothetical protein
MKSISIEPYSESDWSRYGDSSHLQQVRYSIHRYSRIKINGKKETLYYIYDSARAEVPKFANGLFRQRNYAVGRLQTYIAGLPRKKQSALVSEWEKSPITFTHRKKSELRWQV